jgi:hypothetical protein
LRNETLKERKNMKRLALGSILFLLLCGVSAFADPIGPNCGGGNCMGSVYTLSLTDISVGATSTTYQIRLDIDTAAYTGARTDYIHSVAVKITSYDFTGFTSSTIPISLVSSPIGTWSMQAGGNNAVGCNGSGAGWFCSQDGASAVADGSAYTWIWNVTLPNSAGIFKGAFEASVKAEYNRRNGQNAGITSAPITLQDTTVKVPEPSLITLLGFGLGGVSLLLRRRARR